MASVTVSAPDSLLDTIFNYGSLKEYLTKFEECLQALKRPYTRAQCLQSGKLIMKVKLKIANAASLILCSLSKKSSSFKNTCTCLLTNELTINCKLKFLPVTIWLNKAYFGTTNVSVCLHFVFSSLKSVS